MVKYSRQPAEPTKSAKSRVSDLRAHYKNCYETARFCKGMKIKKAIQHMDRVMAHTAIIPYKKYSGGIGRASMAGKVYGVPFGRWPEKACKAVKELLINLQANAETKRLDVEKCVINHVVVQRAVQGRRRTYRAHGRISPYLASNCHIEFHCTEKGGEVKKGDKPQARITKKQAARQRLAIGK
jgi:large subunit ribosomal protein L17e